MTAARQPKWFNRWAWGSGDMLGAGAMAVISSWLFYFYVTFCGLSAGEAGLILGVPRLVDTVACPLIGYVSDNLRHTWIGRKIGRRKIFLMAAIPLLPGFALMWISGQSFWYYLISFVFFEIVYDLVLIPWETLAAEMSKDYTEKARFAGARMLVAQGSAILASYLPTLIIPMLGGKDSAATFLVMATIFGVIFSAVVLLVVIFTWERPYSDAERLVTPEPFDWRKALGVPARMFRDLFSTLRIRAFRQHLCLYLGGYISQDVFNTAFPIFITTVMLGATLVISQLTTLMYGFQFLAVMASIGLIVRAGPVIAYRIAIGFFIAACLLYGAFYLIRPGGVADGLAVLQANLFTRIFTEGPKLSPAVLFWILVPPMLAGLGRGTLNFVPWSVYNYLPDVDEAFTGQRREGVFAGVMTLTRKLTQAVSLMVTGFLIELGGYKSGAADQPAAALDTVAAIMVLGPIAIMLLGLIGAWTFRLNGRTHAVLMGEIERLRAGATAPETEAGGQVVEDLTGWRYGELWGRASTTAKAGPAAVIALVFVVAVVALMLFNLLHK